MASPSSAAPSQQPEPSLRWWRARLPGGHSTTGVVAVFAFTRTQVLGMRAEVDGQRLDPTATAAGEHRVLRLDWTATHTPQEEVAVQVEFRGDVPQIAWFAWITDEAKQVPVIPLPDGLTPFDELDGTRLEYLGQREEIRRGPPTRMLSAGQADLLVARATPTIQEIFAERTAAVDKCARVRRFWLELDGLTHSGLASPGLSAAMQSASWQLFQRLERRAEFGNRPPGARKTPRWAPLPVAGATAARDSLVEVSGALKSTVDAHLVLPDGSSLFESAFVQFATGEATVYCDDPFTQGLLETHGAPDGSEFFKFGELAIACVENGIDQAFWEQHLRALTLGTHLFVENTDVPPPGQARMTGQNGYGHQRGRLFPLARREVLIAEYETRLASVPSKLLFEVLRDLFSSIVAQALPDTPVAVSSALEEPLVHEATVVRQAPAPPPAP